MPVPIPHSRLRSVLSARPTATTPGSRHAARSTEQACAAAGFRDGPKVPSLLRTVGCRHAVFDSHCRFVVGEELAIVYRKVEIAVWAMVGTSATAKKPRCRYVGLLAQPDPQGFEGGIGSHRQSMSQAAATA